MSWILIFWGKWTLFWGAKLYGEKCINIDIDFIGCYRGVWGVFVTAILNLFKSKLISFTIIFILTNNSLGTIGFKFLITIYCYIVLTAIISTDECCFLVSAVIG